MPFGIGARTTLGVIRARRSVRLGAGGGVSAAGGGRLPARIRAVEAAGRRTAGMCPTASNYCDTGMDWAGMAEPVGRVLLGALGGIAGYRGSALYQRVRWRPVVEVELYEPSLALWTSVGNVERMYEVNDRAARDSSEPRALLTALATRRPADLPGGLQALDEVLDRLDDLAAAAQRLPPEARGPRLQRRIFDAKQAVRRYERSWMAAGLIPERDQQEQDLLLQALSALEEHLPTYPKSRAPGRPPRGASIWFAPTEERRRTDLGAGSDPPHDSV
jgi:hypothetical protein